MGMLMAPFGEGRNAPPANEDIARVVAEVLADPAPHIGKSYRPTGPELLSPHDIAGILGDVLGRKVKYQDSSMKMFSKAAKALGASDFEISQIRHYADALRHGAFELGAPTGAFVDTPSPERWRQVGCNGFPGANNADPCARL